MFRQAPTQLPILQPLRPAARKDGHLSDIAVADATACIGAEIPVQRGQAGAGVG